MPKIDKIFAFIAADKDPDDEGIIGMQIDGVFMPFVGGDVKRIESLLPKAKQIAEATGRPFRIIEYSQREDVTNRYMPGSQN